MSEWEPIETAPRDGTPILAYLDSSDYVIIYYSFNEARPSFEWEDNTSDLASYKSEWIKGWMPLPAIQKKPEGKYDHKN